MATGMLYRGDDLYAGHEDDDSYLLYLTREDDVETIRLGRDVIAEQDGDGLVLSSPHTPARLYSGPGTEYVCHRSGRVVPLLPVLRRLLADPSRSQAIF